MEGDSDDSHAFWESHLASAHPLLELPVDKTRPSSRTNDVDFVAWSLPAACGPQLASVAAQWGTSPVLLVLAAWQALLARMSRQDNVTLGVIPSSLLQLHSGGALSAERGGCGNRGALLLLPLSTPVDLEADCLSSLAATSARVLGLMASHMHTPLQDICAAKHVVPSTASHPLFQAAFLTAPAGCRASDGRAVATAAMRGAPPPSPSALSARLIATAFNDGGGNEDSSTAGAPDAPLDLLLLLQGDSLPQAGGRPAGGRGAGPVAGLLAFSTDVFARPMVELMARHLEVFLASALAAPTAGLAGLDMMSPQERQQVLHGFNATAAPLGDASLVHQRFVRCAAEQPEAPCLVFEGATMSYAEVDAVSNRLANTLIQRCGVREGDVVGLLMHRSANMVAGLLGVLKAGGAYLPLDANHPPDRTAFILGDARVKVVVVQPELAHLLPLPSAAETPGGVRHVVLPSTGLDGELAAASAAPPGQLGRPADLAYVIYTSGSTGNPKGVMVTHANLTHFLAWERSEFGYGSGDVFLHKTPTNFDVSVEELWTPLSCGACLVVAKPGGHKDTGHLLALMEAHAVSTLSMVPSQISMLLLEANAARLPALKRIVSAGEALTSSLARQVHEALPHVELVNGYGPTEATVYITHHVVRRGEAGDRPTASIGRPLTNATAYVLDAANRLAPIGVPGELVVSGPQVTRGYLNLPDKTAAVFAPNPYCLGPGSCTDVMYRTGDLARWLPDGRLECLGRTDHQVKLRGYRIELQEIESALSAHDGIQAAVCSIVKDGAGQARLVAYAERPLAGAAVSGPLDRPGLRRSLARRLPAYMVPDALVVLPQLPRLSNEKINRKVLPAPDWAADAFCSSGPATPAAAAASSGGSSGGPAYTAKQLAADAVLAAAVAAWAGALGVDAACLGPASDFAGLGGNSLQAGMMAAALRKALQLPTLSGLLIYSHSKLGAFVSEVKAAAAASCKATAAAASSTAPQLLVSASVSVSSAAAGSMVAPGSASASVSAGRCGPFALPLWFATALQLLAAAVVTGLQIVINLAPLVAVQFLMASGSEWEALAAIPVAKVVAIVGSVGLHLATKWLLVGRYREGLMPINGLHYVAAWVEKLLFRSVQAQLLPFIRGTALMNAYLNALGARVHASAFVDAEDVFEPDLIEVQDGAFVGGNCVLAGATRRAATCKQGEPGGAWRFGTVSYSKVIVGARAVVGPLCVLAGAGASLPDAAVLPPNSSSTDPAALKRGQAMRPESLRCADRPLGAAAAAAALVVLVLFESALLVPATVMFVLSWDALVVSSDDPSPAVMLSCWQTPAMRRSVLLQGQCHEAMHGELLSLALFPIALLLSNLVLVPLLLVPMKWLLMGRVSAAKLASTHPLRVWATHVWVLLQRSWNVRMVTHMLQGTGVYNSLLRALGYKIGRQAWISNANISLVTPDMVSIGATASMGSDVHFYNVTDADEGGIVIGDAVDVGHQATIYPRAVLQPGAVLGAKSNVLAGETLQAGAIRLGNMLLHAGAAAKDVESVANSTSAGSSTNELVHARLIPTWRYVVCNIAVLAGSAVLVPITYMLLSMPMLSVLMVALWEGSGLLVAPAVLLGFLLNTTAILAWMATLRRLLVHSSPGVRPFWSGFFVRWMIWDGPLNVVNTAYTPFFGSVLIVWLYRALGCQVGRDCCLFGGYPGEPDALVIGDGAVLEPYAGASTHTIERRQLTISTVRVHDHTTAGVYSLLLPGAELEAGARLENCSVLLKGERAAAGSTWRGIPAEPVW